MEMVNHPSHYRMTGRRECIEEMRDFGDDNLVSFCLLNAYKDLYRCGEKQGHSREEDISKAKWYFNYAKNMIDKDEAIMVGDRKHDVIGAHENDLPCIGVLYGYGTKEELMACNSDYLVADINALQELLG